MLSSHGGARFCKEELDPVRRVPDPAWAQEAATGGLGMRRRGLEMRQRCGSEMRQRRGSEQRQPAEVRDAAAAVSTRAKEAAAAWLGRRAAMRCGSGAGP